MNLLIAWVKYEEGFRPRPYRDSLGILTVGYGRNLVAHPDPDRDWTRNPYTEAEAGDWLAERLRALYFDLRAHKPIIEAVDTPRAAALMNMAYQLGLAGLLGFTHMWEAVEDGHWITAAAMALDSRWARQTPKRARRVCHTLKTGAWPAEVVREAQHG